jgi:hypothetical protein
MARPARRDEAGRPFAATAGRADAAAVGRNQQSPNESSPESELSAPAGLRALVVEWRMPSREWLAVELEEAGFDVTTCPGPSGPDYDCMGGRGLPCPLVSDADVVVLDLRLEGDEMERGVPAWELATRYRAAGKPLVVLTGDGDPVSLVREPGVEILPRRPGSHALLDAVRRVLAESEGPGADTAASPRP